MNGEMNFRQELVGLFGKPVSENPTQVMVEAAFAAGKLFWRYLTIEVDPASLGDAVKGARAMGFRGFNCTIPHKIQVIPHLDGLGESAALMGAVNCVVNRGGKLIGENTDGKGFVASLQELLPVQGTKVVLLGAGGAARAIGVELALAGASSVTIVNRSEKHGESLTALLNEKTSSRSDFVKWTGDYSVPESADVVVNATSIGLFPDIEARIPLDVRSLHPGLVAADVIPNPPRTRFIRDAENAGCRVIDGLGMLVNQGVLGIEYWTGIKPDPAVMRGALEKVFSS
jgi:shikimate dehydrogenase